MNFTITVPEGTTNHGDPGLLCTPAQWHDYLAFFFGNYVAHAATIVPTPGQSMTDSFFSIFMALLLPGSAIVRSVTVIIRRPATERNPLMCAARAGALCIVLKKPPKPPSKKDKKKSKGEDNVQRDGNSLHMDRRSSTSSLLKTDTSQTVEMEDMNIPSEKAEQQPISTSQFPHAWWNPVEAYAPAEGEHIHGEHWLHKSYYLALVPPTTLPNLQLDIGQKPADTNHSHLQQPPALIASSNNLLKLCISLIQSVWAAITVYRSRGDQIEQYGYAAFGLTVAPYAVMSIINTFANTLTKEYPAIFVLRTPLLNQLESEGKAFFNGALDVVVDPNEDAKPPSSRFGDWVDKKFLPKPGLKKQGNGYFKPITLLSFVISLIPLAINGALTGFQKGNSTEMQRGFTMSWLILGIFYGVSSATEDLYGKKEIGGYVDEDDKQEEGGKKGKRGKSSSEDLAWDVEDGREDGLSKNPSHQEGTQPQEHTQPLGFFGDLMLSCLIVIVVSVVFGAPVIGGMVMVGKMIGEFGICTLLRD